MKKNLILAVVSILMIQVQSFSQNVGINNDNSAPDNSAMLHVKSNSKGILIPNVALTGTTDATTITTPAVSLLVYNTATVSDVTPGYYYNSGTSASPVWTSLLPTAADGSETKVTAGTNVTVTGAGTTVSPYVINSTASGSGTHYLGEEYLGGIIYYLYTDNTGTQKGLIVSKTESTATWSGSAFVNATKTSDGAFNMALMLTGAGTARTWVETLGAGWYLPSIDELSLLWHNRFHVNNSSASGLTFLSSTASYWSSTEYSAAGAFYFYFGGGNASNGSKTNSL